MTVIDQPVRQQKVAGIKAEIDAGTYETPDKIDATVDALIDVFSADDSLPGRIAAGMHEEDAGTWHEPGMDTSLPDPRVIPAPGVPTEAEKADWDKNNCGDQFE